MALIHSLNLIATSRLHTAQRMQNFIRTLLLVTAAKTLTLTSSATVLDWSNLPGGQSWTNGDLTNSFNVDPGNAGNDITVSVASNSAPLSSGFPQNSNTAAGVVHDANYLSIKTSGMVNSSNSVSVTINFNYAAGVNNVSFTVLDVDAINADSSYIDRISAISATPVGGPANSLALTGVNADNTVTTLSGSGTLAMEVQGIVGPGVSDHKGDVVFTTDGTPITSITFTWNNPGPFFDPQIIALGNISFSPVPVPEIGSSLGALTMCASLGAWRRRPAQRAQA